MSTPPNITIPADIVLDPPESGDERREELTMYIFVNKSLGMGKGKIAGQVGHAAQYVTAKILRAGMDCIIQNHLKNILSPMKIDDTSLPDEYERYMKWESGSKKVILQATQEELEQLQKMPESVSVYDAGRTQIAPNSLTVVAFYPSATIGEKFKDYKLL